LAIYNIKYSAVQPAMLKIDNNSNKIKVSVVLPAYNEELVLEQTLTSILEQDYPEPIQLIIADNNSTDKTSEIAKRLGAQVVLEKRKGTRFAYDAGMRAAKGELILVTNADVRLPINWITEIVKAYNDPEVVGVGTKVNFFNAPKWVQRFMNLSYAINPTESMWGTSLSCRRWVYEKAGGFNHGVNTNEDAIFSLIIQKFGKVKMLDHLTVLMDGRRYNQGPLSAIKEWVTGIGLNSIYITLNYQLFGRIKSLINDFGDIRSSIFGKGEQTQISIIVPVNNDQETIARTLSSLQRQEFTNRFKIYVLDNFSIDLSLSIAQVFPNVQVVSYPKVYNFAERLNLLLKEIESPVVAITTASAYLPENWLNQIYLGFNRKRKSDLEVLTGPYALSNGKMLSSITNQPIDKISSKFEFDNFAITTKLLRKVMPAKGSLESVAAHVAKQVMQQELKIDYDMNFKAFHDDVTLISNIFETSSKTIRHTFRKIIHPINKYINGTPDQTS
jgi:glycosyltransferase involved in cell wall biosynthesis